MNTDNQDNTPGSSLLPSNWRQLVGLTVLLVMALAGLNFHWQPPTLSQTGVTGIGNAIPDIIIEQPLIDEFDDAGIHKQQLHGNRLQHFDSDNRSLIDMPVVQFQQTEADQRPVPWLLKADSATLLHTSNQIELQGHVTLSSNATQGGPTEIVTEQLALDTARQFAETNKTVTIRARHSELHASGLKADLANEHLLLPSRVKEIHEARRR